MVDRININNIFLKISPIKIHKENSSFFKLLKEYLMKVDMSQHEADKAIEDLLSGKKDIHDVMLTIEKADISFRLLIRIRNKLLEAYQEIMRMQV